MKCDKCGRDMAMLLVNEFQRDGSDFWVDRSVSDVPCSAAVVETTTNWTGYDLSEEEKLETIRCPHCKQFPFKSIEIQEYEIVRLVMFHESPDGCEHCMGCTYTDEEFTVQTLSGRSVKTRFNFCPNCGRDLRLPQYEMEEVFL